MEIDVKVDDITNCLIENDTGKECDTEFRLSEIITKEKAKKLKSKGWNFDWSLPQMEKYDVYKLYIKGNNEVKYFKED